ncbi:hypothetical protein V1511DRAFT_501911 [Dipodascopsis uninucleata]
MNLSMRRRGSIIRFPTIRKIQELHIRGGRPRTSLGSVGMNNTTTNGHGIAESTLIAAVSSAGAASSGLTTVIEARNINASTALVSQSFSRSISDDANKKHSGPELNNPSRDQHVLADGHKRKLKWELEMTNGESRDANGLVALEGSNGSKGNKNRDDEGNGDSNDGNGNGNSEDDSATDINDHNESFDENRVLTVSKLVMRYAHHFDTYAIFRSLHSAGFTDEQSIEIIKCMRGLLSHELIRAKETFLSQAEMENEAYLFDAACSELRTEIQSLRRNQTAVAQTETAALQRELALLRQLYTEEIDYMKNDINMELNERKNASNADARATEIQIQELNNKITIQIISELRSAVEATRWQMTRRGLVAIGFIAGIILTALSYRSESDQRRSKEAAAKAVASGESAEKRNESSPEVIYIS